MKTTLYAVIAAALPFAASAADITVHDAYLRSSSPMSGAGFMQIDNTGAADCQLSAVSSPAAGKAELHTHIDENGMMKMVHVPEGFTIPAGGSFMLERGGPHVMLMDLVAPLAQGDEATLTLDFGDCGQVEVTAAVDNDRKPEAGAGH